VGETEATVWVETDEPCEVEVLGAKERTWCVEGHHYALVHVEGLEPGTTTPYSLALDGEIVWPEPTAAFPQATIRTHGKPGRLRLAFGSCRVSAPHEPPYSLRKDQDERGREIDALYAYVKRMTEQDAAEWPHLLLLVGDQVYADEASPGTRDFICSRRDASQPPGEQVADFEEYTRLYWDAWGDPAVRWILSTVPSAMIFDDHDVHDDWNTSQAWLDEYRAKPWWNERIIGAVMSYWVYQHIGNLSPRDLAEDELYARVREDGRVDAGPLLREFAYRADREVEGTRWSYARDLGHSRLIVMDSRAGRVLDGERKMVDDDEWDYIQSHADGDFEHLLLATSLPLLLAPGMHYMEAWNEAVCDGAWGAPWARLGEKIRQGLDLEHWAAFIDSFDRVVELMREVAAGERGTAPASVIVLSGDVHHAYLAEVAYPARTPVESNVVQAVCSPVRNPLDSRERRAIKLAGSTPARWVTRALARAAGVSDPGIRWRLVQPPTFDNQVATIDLEGREARMRIEKAVPGDPNRPRLDEALNRRIA
jgi:integrase